MAIGIRTRPIIGDKHPCTFRKKVAAAGRAALLRGALEIGPLWKRTQFLRARNPLGALSGGS